VIGGVRRWKRFRRLLRDVGERLWYAILQARAEHTLRESEQRLRTLIRSLPGSAVFVVDQHLKYVIAQGEGLAAAGYRPEDLLGRRVAEAIGPVQGTSHEAKYRRALDGEGFEVEHAEHGRTFLTRGVPLSNAAGGIDGVLALSYDITERKHTEEALQASERRLQLFVSASSDIVYRMSPDWHEMYSLEGKGILADTRHPSSIWLETYIPDSETDAVQATVREAVRTRRMFELEHRIRRADGTVGWAFSRAVPLLDERGGVVEWFGTTSDITGRKRAEAALQASEERFRTVVNLVPDLLWQSEPDGTIVWYNQRWQEFTGQTLEQALGWGWTDAIHLEDREGLVQRYRQAAETGEPLQQEHRIRRHDGEYRWFQIYMVPLKDALGQVIQIYGAASDIHALRTANALLEARVEDRTQRLTDLNSELRALATVSSQQLSEPLRRLRGFLQLLERRIASHLDDKTRHYFDLMQADAQQAERLAEDFKGLAYLEQRELKSTLVPLLPLVMQVRSDLAPRLSGQTVQWNIGDLPAVRGDAMLLRQVFTEVFHHILKRVPAYQKAQVEVKLRSAVEPVVIGIAVSPVRAVLMDLSGDGVATARRLMQRQGGQLTVDVQDDQVDVRIHWAVQLD